MLSPDFELTHRSICEWRQLQKGKGQRLSTTYLADSIQGNYVGNYVPEGIANDSIYVGSVVTM